MAGDNIFSGLKVVDFATFVAAPGAAVILSDFGADVIKVEPPSGDLWRYGNKIPVEPQSDDPYQWHLANRNKRGIVLNLKSPSAQQVLEKLVKWADVLVVNTPHRPGRSAAAETTRPPSAFIPRSLPHSIVVSALARGRMSRPHSSPRVYGRQA